MPCRVGCQEHRPLGSSRRASLGHQGRGWHCGSGRAKPTDVPFWVHARCLRWSSAIQPVVESNKQATDCLCGGQACSTNMAFETKIIESRLRFKGRDRCPQQGYPLCGSQQPRPFLKEKYYSVSALLAVAAVIHGCVFNIQSMALCVCVCVCVCAGGREGEGRFKATVCMKRLEQCPQQSPALMSAARAAYLHGELACIYGPKRGCDFSRSCSLCMHNLIIF